MTHPDIEEFIDVKNDLTKVTKANISVGITDEFMWSVKNNTDWKMKFVVEYDNADNVEYEKTVNARYLFRKIAESSWRTAEPGILFWDNVNNYHINDQTEGYEYSATNPCGEKPLLENGSCLLASINLSEFVKNSFTDTAEFLYEEFDNAIPAIVRYMDDLLEEGLAFLPLDAQKQVAIDWRQIGIGFMGLADCLIKLKITYGSEESINFIHTMGNIFANKVLQSSALLAKERGAYPKYDRQAVLKSTFINNVAKADTLQMIADYGLRNSELISIAPTGSISTMFGVSGGVEPVFQFIYTRRTESLNDGETFYKVYTQIVKDYMEHTGQSDINQLPAYFIESQSLPYINRIKVQNALQKYVDSAISSTVNLPNEATIEQVEDVYMQAWEHKLKGITIYRDGCERQGILLSNKKETNRVEELKAELDDALAQALQDNPNECPMCGTEMIRTNGCKECQDCGYSPCSV